MSASLTLETLLNAEEAKGVLSVSTPRLYQLARAGVVPSVRLGRQLRFSPSALQRFIERGGRALAESGEPEERAGSLEVQTPSPGRKAVAEQRGDGGRL